MIYLRDLLSDPIRTVSLTAIIDTALCVGAGGSSGSLADKPIVRTADGRLLIPGSQLKGRVRHECEKFARGLGWKVCHSPTAETMCPQRRDLNSELDNQFHRDDYRVEGDNRYHCIICQIFGNPALPSRVEFDDLICSIDAATRSEVLRPGVTINRRRRTAEDRKLYFLETSPVATQLPFSGDVRIHPNAPTYAKPLILAALHHIKALGGSKSAGLGWLHWEFDEFAVDESAWSDLLPPEKS